MNPEPGTSVLLTNDERQRLARVGREAWLYMKGKGATDESFDEFRHRIAIQACGRRISEAIRSDFNLIKAAFEAILGRTKAAVRSAERSLTEGKRIAVHKLRSLLESQGRHESYATPLFRSMYKTTMEAATAAQVWKVYYELGGTSQQRAQRRKNWKARSKLVPAQHETEPF
jgi:hypothetical protein